MSEHTGSTTEPSFAPNSTSTSAGAMGCSTSNASCAAIAVGALMLKVTEESPSPSAIDETAMSVASKDGPSSLASSAGKLLASKASLMVKPHKTVMLW
eukprot:scaffold54397_cov54-Phaeocystis_antarctica.AAC.1